MAQLSASEYDEKYNDPIMGLLKDNTNREIVPARHRLQITDTKDSFVNKKTDGFYDVASTDGVNSYTASMNPVPDSYVSGHSYRIKFDDESTGVVTLNLNGMGAKKVYKAPTEQATDGDILAGQILHLVYDTDLDSSVGGFSIVGGGTATGASGSDFVESIVDTTGDVITLDFESKSEGGFSGSDTFSATREVVRTNDSRARLFDFMFEVTDVDIPIDFGSDTRSTHALFVDGVFTPQDVGLYKVHGKRYGPGGSLWMLDFNGVYSVGDAPPEPPDPPVWVLGSGTWNDAAYWDDSAIWDDTP